MSRSLNVHPNGTDLGHGRGTFCSGGGATPPPCTPCHMCHICGSPIYGSLQIKTFTVPFDPLQWPVQHACRCCIQLGQASFIQLCSHWWWQTCCSRPTGEKHAYEVCHFSFQSTTFAKGVHLAIYHHFCLKTNSNLKLLLASTHSPKPPGKITPHVS